MCRVRDEYIIGAFLCQPLRTYPCDLCTELYSFARVTSSSLLDFIITIFFFFLIKCTGI